MVFYEKDVPYYASRRDFKSCDYCLLVLYESWERIRWRAIRDARESDAVIVASYCPDGARISDYMLNVPGPLHIFYDLDTPITLHKLERGDLDYLRRDQVPEFDLYLSFTGGGILSELEQRWGAQRALPLYGCVDPEVYMRVDERPEFRGDLSYMGTHAADREHKLRDLFLKPARRMAQSQFVLGGSLYPREWQWPANVRRFDHIAPGDHAAFYSSSRATLNITRDGMARTGYCPSGRFFEAAACGAPILTDYWEGLESFFTPEDEILVVKKAEDVIEILSCYDGALADIAARARQRTLDEHTGERRAAELISHMEKTASPATAPVLQVAR